MKKGRCEFSTSACLSYHVSSIVEVDLLLRLHSTMIQQKYENVKKPTKNSYTEIYRCVGIVQILQQLISEALSQDKYEMNRCFLSVYG